MGTHRDAGRDPRGKPTIRLFPAALSGPTAIEPVLNDWSRRIDRSSSLPEFLDSCWDEFLAHGVAEHSQGNRVSFDPDPTRIASTGKSAHPPSSFQFTLVLLASSLEDLRREIDVCRRTWSGSWTNGRDWKTPTGSFLSPNPAGCTGKLAFVYPGIGSLYPGYSRDLLQVFPQALDDLPSVSRDELFSMLHTDLLWPDNPETPGTAATSDDWPLYKDIVSQAEATVSLAYVWTHLLREKFQLQPEMALGYSLGELAMFSGCSCWTRPQELSERFREWPSFRSRLGGDMSVLGTSPAERESANQQWLACVVTLNRPASEICPAIEPPLYVTHINTSKEIVIAGGNRDVTDWMSRNGVRGQPVPSKLVYHCSAVSPEAATLEALFELPVAKRPNIDFVSMAPFAKIPHDVKAIARTLVNTALKTVDFPEIVETSYRRGARVFVEIGPRNSCSSWIQSILSGRPLITASTDQKGFDVATSLTRMLAVLLSHQVPMSPIAVSSWTRTTFAERQ